MELEGCLERFKGGLQVFQTDMDEAAAGQGAKVARFQIEGFYDVFEGGIEIFHQIIDGGALVPAFGKVWRGLNDMGEGGKRSGEIAGLHALDAFIEKCLSRVVRRLQPDAPDLLLDSAG